MKRENYNENNVLASLLEWDEKTKTLTFTTFQDGKTEGKKVVTGCVTFQQAKNFLT